MKRTTCKECGALLQDGKTCQEYFHQMLTWDFEDFAGAGSVHHITVLCYYLQHSNLYSREALEDAKQMLKELVEKNKSGKELYERNKQLLSNQVRDWKISGTPEQHGAYKNPISWSLTASAIVSSGVENYPEMVKKWAASIYHELKRSENF